MSDVVAIIGGGPAGLAAAATLKPLGLTVRVLEQAEGVGARWRNHYDRLHLHTTRTGSALPGMNIPSQYGRWVKRDDFVTYQEQYAKHHGIELETGTTVERVERDGQTKNSWKLTTSKGSIDATYVIVATGYNNLPYLPAWPGRETFTGALVHSREYRSGAIYTGKRVLVVGTGNTGAEIATDLVEQGAAEVWWSFRTPPVILPRALVGIATQAFGIMLRPLSPKLVDPIMAGVARLWIGNLKKYGLPKATRGGYTGVLEDHVLPILDVGLVAAIKRGQVKPVTTIEAFDASSVVLSDGQRLEPEAVIACTGYRTALDSIVGHLGVLDKEGIPTVSGPTQHEGAPNMYFLGYTNALSGNIREIAAHARQVADVIGRTDKLLRTGT
ncbi:NAD(P)/FAD-dependent oxidoreductase [soil metagenome]